MKTTKQEIEMTVQEAMETRRWCYYINPTQDSHATGGFVPSVVIENFPGHYPAMGKGECAAPWVWGDTLKKAETTCRRVSVIAPFLKSQRQA